MREIKVENTNLFHDFVNKNEERGGVLAAIRRVLADILRRIKGVLPATKARSLSNIVKQIDTLLEAASAAQEQATVETTANQDGDYKYSLKETDPATLKRLNSGETIKAYRAMQVIDGKLYPPMSARVDGKLREPIELGVWEKAEERPDLADDKGYFKLDKGNNSSLKARYNPYIHTSLTPLNDQFSSAQDRPNLVTVEVEVPASELTSGYKADKAKDTVGKVEWKAGVVQSQLSGTRTVILSRWDRPLRIIPDSEVAQRIVEMFGDSKIAMPSNVVTPSLRAELEKLGVPFKETTNQGKEIKKRGVTKHNTSEQLGQPTTVNGNPPVANLGTKLNKNYETAITDIENLIKEKGALSAHEFLHELNNALIGFNESSTDGSYYIDIGDGFTIRVSDHYSNANTFKRFNNTEKNYGIVIKLKTIRFKSDPNVNYVEFVYFPDKLDSNRQLSILDGVKGMVKTKDIGKLPTPDNTHTSGKTLYSLITPQMDAPYLEAVERGDMETAQRMVLEAAKLAMPDTKIVDENGFPKVVYHQTNATEYVNVETGERWDDLDWMKRAEWNERDDWDEYWQEREFYTFSRANARTTQEFDGFFFAPEYDEYHEYGDRTISAFLNIKNPASRTDYNIDSSKNNAGREERLRLQQEGYDGVIREEDGIVWEYVAFEPNQIKSADPVTYDDNGNVIPLSERFNPEKEDIRYSLGQPTDEDVTFDNFFERTSAIFTQITDTPTAKPDYISRSGSTYWYGEDERGKYVIRRSDHWSAIVRDEEDAEAFNAKPDDFNNIASCYWALDMRTYKPQSLAPINKETVRTINYNSGSKDLNIVFNDGKTTRRRGVEPRDMRKYFELRNSGDMSAANGSVVDMVNELYSATPMPTVQTAKAYLDEFTKWSGESEQKSEQKRKLYSVQEVMDNFNLTEDNAFDYEYALMKSIAGADYSARGDYSVVNGVEVRVKGHTPNWDNFLDWETDEPRHKIILNVTVGDYNNTNYRRNKTTYEEFVAEHPDTVAVDVTIDDGTTLGDALKQIHDTLAVKNVDFSFNPNYDWVDFYSEENNDLSERQARYSLQEVNDRFNEELATLTEENARERILNIGIPSPVLLACGIENKPIRLYGAKLLSKARKHSYNIEDLKNLPLAINEPIAVFKGSKSNSFAILTELRIADNNVLATLSVGRGGHDVDFNIISSVYDKRDDSVARWVNDGKLLYVDKEKALDYFSVSAPLAEAQNNQELISTTKVIQNFENPKIEPRFSLQAPAFYSNAEYAVRGIKQEKATPEQWLKMIEKSGGLKAGEDKWLGLSDWLKASDKKSLTKDEVLQYIAENDIQIEEVEYFDSANISREEVYESDEFGALSSSLIEYDEDDAPYINQERYKELQDADPDFLDGFAIDYWGESIEIDDTEAAARYLGLINGGQINPTRLEYTTSGLKNKREIALVVPTIEPYNAHDGIHFGDAGGGRAVAWVRFGEANAPRIVPMAQYVEEFEEPFINATGREVYMPKGQRGSKDYVVYGKLKTGDSAYVVYIKDVQLPVPHKTLDEARNAMNEYYVVNPRNITRYDRVLVIDEIQSKRHQDGREKGYISVDIGNIRAAAKKRLNKAYDDAQNYRDALREKYNWDKIEGNSFSDRVHKFNELLSEEEIAERKRLDAEATEASDEWNKIEEEAKRVPSAPFEKNWAELAMKRMLRYAAENGFDKVAWTTGEQQSERYDLSQMVDYIDAERNADGSYNVNVATNDDSHYVQENNISEKRLSELVGKDIAYGIISSIENSDDNKAHIEADDMTIGGAGMKAFYDQMLPSFVRKYAKKWGATVGEVTMPDLEENNTMHSVDVTPAMRESVMQGQPKFSLIGELGAANLDKAEEATKRLDNLAVARDMETAGKDAKTIKLATGWERGADGKWRYEIDDAVINQNAIFNHRDDGVSITLLGELLTGGELLKAYPQLDDMVVVYQELPLGTLGGYSPANKLGMPANIVLSDMFLSRRENPEWRAEVERMEQEPIIKAWSDAMTADPYDNNAYESAEQAFKASPLWEEYNNLLMGKGKYPRLIKGIGGREALLHEVQHAIQDIEGFAMGGNTKSEDYNRLAGEVEARNVEKRANMTTQERLASLAEETEDVARKDQIILREGVEMEMGSRVTKRMAEIKGLLQDKELTPEQRKVVDVYTGNSNNEIIKVQREDGVHRVVIRQGNENKVGVKHSVLRHYDTGVGYITAEDILRIPEIISLGHKKTEKRGNITTSEYSIIDTERVKHSVITEYVDGREVFDNYYTNRKASLDTRKTRSEEARDSSSNAYIEYKDTTSSPNIQEEGAKFSISESWAPFSTTEAGEIAKQMRADGALPSEIYARTGWWWDAKGRMRSYPRDKQPRAAKIVELQKAEGTYDERAVA